MASTRAAIATAERGVAFVDYVSSGGSMGDLVTILRRLAEVDGANWPVVERRLRLIGLTERSKNSPNTWRWRQHQDWLAETPKLTVKDVSAPMRFLYFVANDQAKVTWAFHAGRWDLEAARRAPEHREKLMEPLRFAVSLYDRGRSREERAALAAEIAALPQMRQPATRRIVAMLK